MSSTTSRKIDIQSAKASFTEQLLEWESDEEQEATLSGIIDIQSIVVRQPKYVLRLFKLMNTSPSDNASVHTLPREQQKELYVFIVVNFCESSNVFRFALMSLYPPHTTFKAFPNILYILTTYSYLKKIAVERKNILKKDAPRLEGIMVSSELSCMLLRHTTMTAAN